MARTKQTARAESMPKTTPKTARKPAEQKQPKPSDKSKREFKLLVDKLSGGRVPDDWTNFGELTEQSKTPLLAAKAFFVRLCKFTSEDGCGEFTLFVEEQGLPEGTKKKSVFGYSGSRVKKSESEINELKEKKAAKAPGEVVVPTTHNLTIKAYKPPTDQQSVCGSE